MSDLIKQIHGIPKVVHVHVIKTKHFFVQINLKKIKLSMAEATHHLRM